MVLDAFALGALSRAPELAKPLSGRLVLTPTGPRRRSSTAAPEQDVDDLATAVRIADRYGGVVLLMGVVAEPGGRTWRDGSGHVGLATSGSGDVLAGLTGGFLARRAEARPGRLLGDARPRRTAGQRLIPRRGRVGLLARELVAEIPTVIAELTG